MYKIAICDDDKRYRKTIREIVEHENSLHENEIRFYEYESEMNFETYGYSPRIGLYRHPYAGAGWKPNSIKIEKL